MMASSLVWSHDLAMNQLSALTERYIPQFMPNNQSSGYIDEFMEYLHDNQPSSSIDVSIDLEIIFRSQLQSILIGKKESTNDEDHQLFHILRFTLAMACHPNASALSGNLAKLPFILLEEIFSSVTILRAEKLWIRLEELIEVITNPELFSKGQLIVLRICNSLLRKLSKSYNTEFCGRILMFLAAVYPLSEKSALNIQGQVNINNITSFDSEEDFLAAMVEQSDTASYSKDMVISQPTTSISSSARKGEEGEIDADDYTLPRSLADDHPTTTVSSTTADLKLSSSSCDYHLYKTFWSLQSYFSADSKALDSAEKWTALQQSLAQVFILLQANATTNTSSSSSAAVSDSMVMSDEVQVNTGSMKTYFGCKFLTSAKLLGLQLRDPLLRQQLACQILFFTHYLRKNPPVFVDPPASPAPATVISIASKAAARSTARAASTSTTSTTKPPSTPTTASQPPPPSTSANKPSQPPPPSSSTTAMPSASASKPPPPSSSSSTRATTAPASLTAASTSASTPTSASTTATPSNPLLVKFLEEVNVIEELALTIIRRTNHGQQLDTMLRSLLYSEARYLRWKAASCPPYERPHLTPSLIPSSQHHTPSWLVDISTLSGDDHSKYRIPRYLGKKAKNFEAALESISERKYTFDSDLETAKEYARLLVDGIPTFHSYAQDYLDAEDPNQGIEDSYHPKHDSVYCWRLRRLMSRERLSAMEVMSDGSVTKGLIAMEMMKAPIIASTNTTLETVGVVDDNDSHDVTENVDDNAMDEAVDGDVSSPVVEMEDNDEDGKDVQVDEAIEDKDHGEDGEGDDENSSKRARIE